MKRLKKVAIEQYGKIQPKDIIGAFLSVANFEFSRVYDEDFLHTYMDYKNNKQGADKEISLNNLIIKYYIDKIGFEYLYDELRNMNYDIPTGDTSKDEYIKGILNNYDQYTNISIFEELESSIDTAYENTFDDEF